MEKKRASNLCDGGSSKESRNQTVPKHIPQKREKELLFGRSAKSVTVKLLVLKGTYKYHIYAMIFLSKKYF